VTLTLPQGGGDPARTSGWVRIYTADGRLVQTLSEGNPLGGETNFVWDGTNSSGNEVTSGVYFVAARTGAGVTRTKLVLVR
jgi:flagellar hook assembly protein FlgD